MPESFNELVTRVRAGDEAAAATLLRTYQSAIMRVIRVRLVDPRLRRVIGASDVFQSVMSAFFVNAALGRYELSSPEDLLKLLATIARNKVADKARRRSLGRDPATVAVHELAEGPPATGPSLSRRLELTALAREARARLGPELLEVVALREEGLTWSDIAARLGGNADALRKRLARAVEEIAGALELP